MKFSEAVTQGHANILKLRVFVMCSRRLPPLTKFQNRIA